MHPDSSHYPRMIPEDATEKQREIVKALQDLDKHDGRYIGKTEKQPDWCPLKQSQS